MIALKRTSWTSGPGLSTACALEPLGSEPGSLRDTRHYVGDLRLLSKARRRSEIVSRDLAVGQWPSAAKQVLRSAAEIPSGPGPAVLPVWLPPATITSREDSHRLPDLREFEEDSTAPQLEYWATCKQSPHLVDQRL